MIHNPTGIVTYRASVALTLPYLAVARAATYGEVKIATTAGTDQEAVVGFAQATADAAQAVAVATMGTTYARAGGTIARGDRLAVNTSADDGTLVALVEPVAPGAATTPTAAEVDAVNAYALALQNYNERTIAIAEQPASSGDIFIVRIAQRGAGL